MSILHRSSRGMNGMRSRKRLRTRFQRFDKTSPRPAALPPPRPFDPGLIAFRTSIVEMLCPLFDLNVNRVVFGFHREFQRRIGKILSMLLLDVLLGKFCLRS